MFDKIKENAREVLSGSNPENDLRACLHADHVDVGKMISRLLSSDDDDMRDLSKRQNVLSQLVIALTAHARAEEEIVYDRLRTEPELGLPIREAFREHEDIETHLNELSSMALNDSRFLDVLRQLKVVVDSHVHDEENQVLPRAESLLGKEVLANLIPSFNTRKANLMRQLKGDQDLGRAARTPVDPMSESSSQY
jgi:hemerythrin superfamily protein